MIEAINLRKQYGRILAVDDVSFSVQPGEILGFLGPNGAGKSTTMKMITGFLRPDKGTARILGHDIATAPLQAKASFGYLPETGPLYPEMTVEDFLGFCARMRGYSGTKATAAIERAAGLCHLESVWRQQLDTLSKGYRQRVGLAQAVLHDPACLIMDEPTDGLDPNQKREVRKLIASMATDKAILLSTHILEEVEAMCSRVIIINHGKVVVDATPEQLKARHPDHNCFRVRTTGDSLTAIRQWAENGAASVREANDQTITLHWKDPSAGQAALFSAASAHSWSVTAIEPLPVPLEAVFAQLTSNTLN